MPRRKRDLPKGILRVGSKELRVRLMYDPYNKAWEAKLSKTQLRSILLGFAGKILIKHSYVYDPNYDGVVNVEEGWRKLSPEGIKWIIDRNLKYAESITYNPKKGFITVYDGAGNIYHLKIEGVETRLVPTYIPKWCGGHHG